MGSPVILESLSLKETVEGPNLNWYYPCSSAIFFSLSSTSAALSFSYITLLVFLNCMAFLYSS